MVINKPRIPSRFLGTWRDQHGGFVGLLSGCLNSNDAITAVDLALC